MAEVRVSVPVEEASIQAVVIRCGCAVKGEHPGEQCPNPRALEDLGTISYYHRNPVRRFMWRTFGRIR